MSDRHALLYDRDCGFCRWSTAWVVRLDRRGELLPVAIQDPRGQGLLADVDPAARLASAHLVAPDGRRHSAGALVGPLLRLIPGGRPLATLAERLPGATSRAYRFVAEHRSTFGRPLTDAAKRRADALIRARAEADALAPDPVLVEGAAEEPEDDQRRAEQQEG